LSIIAVVTGALSGKGTIESSDGKDGVYHIVESGETLLGISQDYHVPMNDIIRDNPFLENRLPRVGDTLYIANAEKTIAMFERKGRAEGKK
jgi:LysM repeat protein